MRTKAEVLRHFDDLAAGGRWAGLYDRAGDAVTNYSFIVRRRRVQELLEPIVRPDMRVLDVGCGTGVMAPFVLTKGAHYHGLDLSESMIAQAAERCGPNDAEAPAEPTAVFSVGDVEDLPYADEHFDVVMALGLFEYLDDVDSAADSLLRVTKPGGTVVVSVPSATCADALACRVFSPFVTTAARALRQVLGTGNRPDNFSHRKSRPGKLDRLFASRGAEKSGQSFYNLEMAFYPLRRLLPGPSLWLKERAEPHHEGPLRLFATAYIGRYVKRPAQSSEPT